MKYYLKFGHFDLKEESTQEAYDQSPDLEQIRRLVENCGASVVEFAQDDVPHLEDWSMTIECSERQWRMIQMWLDHRVWWTTQEDAQQREEQWQIEEEYLRNKYQSNHGVDLRSKFSNFLAWSPGN